MLSGMKSFPIRTLSALIAVLLPAAFAGAQVPAADPPPKGYTAVMPLWQSKAPGAVGDADVDVPKIYSYPAAGPGPHPAVVVLPGGGYTHVVTEKEGGAPARWLQAHGVSAYVVQYRLWPRYRYPWPLADGERAVRYVRAHAKEWGLRKDAIGVWGFSAGGHMAGFLSTVDPHDHMTHPGDVTAQDDIDNESAHPDFAILSYGRVDLDPKIPGTFGMQTLVGPNATQAELDAVDPILHVTRETSPAIIYSTEGDEKVNSQNASHYFEALHTAGVPAELHIFEEGPHGTGMGQGLKQTELAIWPTLLEHWLQQHGWMPAE
jgi:acetyl esterase/lipase